jgi:enoyl-CoA hydratase/carnithine racemase
MDDTFAPYTGSTLRLSWPERAVALVTLTRPQQMNTISFELIDELTHTLDLIERAATRVLVITGEETAFCCGAHLHYFAGPGAVLRDGATTRERYLGRIAALFDRLEALPLPTIAAINGFALGGGMELALACDLRLLSTTATMGLPETRIGAIAGAGGVQKLVRHVGRGTALDWTLRGLHVDALTVQRHGLCSDVVTAERLLPRALELARELRRLSPQALAESKRCIAFSDDADLPSAQAVGLDALIGLVGGRDWNEGMAAFVERRAPAFETW